MKQSFEKLETRKSFNAKIFLIRKEFNFEK